MQPQIDKALDRLGTYFNSGWLVGDKNSMKKKTLSSQHGPKWYTGGYWFIAARLLLSNAN